MRQFNHRAARSSLLVRSLGLIALSGASYWLAACAAYGPGLLGSDNADLQGAGAYTTDGGASAAGGDANGGSMVEIVWAGSSNATTGSAGADSSAGGAIASAGSETSGGGDGSTDPVAAGAGGGLASNAGSGGSVSAAGTYGGGAAGMGAAGAAPAPVVELARGKPVSASSHQAGNDAFHGNDGNWGTRWCAKDETFPQFWRVDLGAMRTLQDFSVRVEHPDAAYAYQIETSADDAVYVLRATVSGTGAVQSATFPGRISARYVRITITSGGPWKDSSGNQRVTWACFYEFAVNGY